MPTDQIRVCITVEERPRGLAVAHLLPRIVRNARSLVRRVVAYPSGSCYLCAAALAEPDTPPFCEECRLAGMAAP